MPNLTENEKKIADELLMLDSVALKNQSPVDPDETLTNLDALRIQDYLYTKMNEELGKVLGSEQQAAYVKLAQLATGTIPPGLDLRDSGRLVLKLLNNYVEATQQDETMSEAEKDYIVSTRDYVRLFDMIRQPTPPDASKVKMPLASTHVIDYIFRGVPAEKKQELVGRVLVWSDSPSEHLDFIVKNTEVPQLVVEKLVTYLLTEPSARAELWEMGYSDEYLPSWIPHKK
jgi:hypothetical protein